LSFENNQSPEMHKYSKLITLCAFAILIVSLLNGCGAFHNAQIHEVGKVQFGFASWYGKKFQGRKTSSGEIYDMHEFTAAHRAFPFGTIVKVTNIKNGRSAVVKINDRGPQKRSRKLDVSYAAAKKIGMIRDGIARVRIEVVNDSYASALYEQQKELWNAFNIDAYFDESPDPYIIQSSLPIAQSKFFKENRFAGLKFDKIPPKVYEDVEDTNMIMAGISQ